MKSSDILLFGAAGIAAWILFGKVQAATSLLFFPGRVTNVYFEGSTPVIEMTLITQNTSSSGFVLESLAGNIFSDGVYIGNVSSFLPISINANSENTIMVRARLSALGIVNQIFSAFAGNTIKKVRLTGFANTGFARAPIDVEFNVGR